MDNNVTRHIRKELEQDDWNGMILHYLGLDHIGHKSGPRRYIYRVLRTCCIASAEYKEAYT